MSSKSKTKTASAPYKFKVGDAVITNSKSPLGANHTLTVSTRWQKDGINYYLVGGVTHTEDQLN